MSNETIRDAVLDLIWKSYPHTIWQSVGHFNNIRLVRKIRFDPWPDVATLDIKSQYSLYYRDLDKTIVDFEYDMISMIFLDNGIDTRFMTRSTKDNFHLTEKEFSLGWMELSKQFTIDIQPWRVFEYANPDFPNNLLAEINKMYNV